MARRLDTLDPKSILVVKPSALGDICHSLPVLDFFHSRFPKAKISWVVVPPFAPLLAKHPAIDRLVLFERSASTKGGFALVSKTFALVRDLRSVQADLAIDLQGLLRSGLITLASGAPVRIGLGDSREGARWTYTHTVPIPGQAVHAVERYWQVARALNGPETCGPMHLPIPKEDKDLALQLLVNLPKPWVILGPGSRWLTKRWLPSHFAEVGRRLRDQMGASIILVGSPDEAPVSAEINHALGQKALNLTGQTSLGVLAGLLSLADLVIANDTGPLHLAVAAGARVVSPFTCTSVAKTGPYGQLDNAVATTVDCRESFLRECPSMKCMNELTPDRLWPRILAHFPNT